MKGLFLVEPVIAVYAFTSFLVYPLVQQYVYRRLWQELTNSTFPVSDNTSRCTNDRSNQSSYHEEVQRQASLFSLYSGLFSMIPSLTITLILVAYSDQRGRKVTIIMPLIGSLLYNLSFLVVSYFELNVYLLIGSMLVSSLFGGLGTFLGGCFAYIADLCEDGRQKTLRLAGADMVIGLLSGLASLLTGYFLRAAGFNWPFLTSVLLQCLILLYTVFVLEETVQMSPSDATNVSGPGCWPLLRQMLSGIFHLFTGPDHRTNIIMALLMLILATFSFAHIGGLSMMTLYELNKPLCWSEILIGYGSALSTTVFLTSFVGVWLFTLCGVPQLVIILLGILSVILGMILVVFAKTTLLMFLVRLPMLLSIMPFPVLRSMMSRLISQSEQGALFACVAFSENLSNNVAGMVFSSIYASTVAWYPGFCFILAAGLCLIPLAFLGVLGVLGVDVAIETTNSEALTLAEEQASADENDNDGPPLS